MWKISTLDVNVSSSGIGQTYMTTPLISDESVILNVFYNSENSVKVLVAQDCDEDLTFDKNRQLIALHVGPYSGYQTITNKNMLYVGSCQVPFEDDGYTYRHVQRSPDPAPFHIHLFEVSDD